MAGYFVEENLPIGFSLVNVTGGGAWNATARKLDWGPYLDVFPRSFGYQIQAPDGFNGTVSISGSVFSFDLPVWGDRAPIGDMSQTAQATQTSQRSVPTQHDETPASAR